MLKMFSILNFNHKDKNHTKPPIENKINISEKKIQTNFLKFNVSLKNIMQINFDTLLDK